MTSIATYLASLTGAAPKEGQNTIAASANGAGGLFSALLGSTQGNAEIEGGVALPEFPSAISPTAQVQQVDSEALVEGLALAEGTSDVEAAVIDTLTEGGAGSDIGASTLATAGDEEGSNIATLLEITEASSQAGDAGVSANPQDIDATAQAVIADNAGIQAAASDTDAVVPAAAQTGTTPETVAAAENNADKPTGLQNALERASQNGRENGLQQALNNAARPRGQFSANAGPESNGQGDARATGSQQSDENISDRPRPSVTAGDEGFNLKPGAGRPEFKPATPRTIQNIIQNGQGQNLIQTQTVTGGEISGLTSPPTLTVNVQASAASPGPVSPNTPHVPVGSLAVHIAQQANNGARRFDIRLDPPELGRIEVRLDVSREGQVMTHLVVERSETLDLLQRDARQLERALNDAGLDLSDEGMKFSLKDEGLAEGDNGQSEDDEKAASGKELNEETDTVENENMPPPEYYSLSTGLDIRI